MKVTIQDSRTSVTVEPRDFRVTVSGARGPQGDAGIGIAAGGAEGQILAKASATDYDTEWIDNYAVNVEVYVKNSSGSPMTKGQVVYISGADGTNPTISLAIATSEMGSSKTIGWLKQDLTNGAFGYVITEGLLEGINTNSAGAAGDPVWLSPTTAGGVVYGLASKPSAPNHLVFLGYVLRKQTNNGKVYVKVQNGFELGELHDIYNGTKTTPVSADALLLRDSADSNLWKRLTWTNALAGVKSHMDTFKSVAGGYASLDGSGKVPSSELPSYVDDVVEVASFAALPVTGETGKIYVTLDTNKCYRWSGSVYIQVAQGVDTLTTTGTSGAATLVGNTLNIPQYQGVLTNPVTGTGTAGQVAYFNGTSAVTGSANLFWDNTNGRLGIGTASPAASLSIASSATLATGIQLNNAGSIGYIYGDGTSLNLRAGGTYGFQINANSAILQNTAGGTGSFRLDLQALTTSPIFSFLGDVDTGIGRNAADTLTFFSGGERARFDSSGNYVIGATAATARLHVRGSGTTSATTALLVQNSAATDILTVRDDNRVIAHDGIRTGGVSTVAGVFPQGTINQENILIRSSVLPTSTGIIDITLSNGQGDPTNTTGTRTLVNIHRNFSPTSGSGNYNLLWITSTINQTGGANGITRGLYVNPTLTAAADWRSIETSNNTGYAAYFAGSADLFLGNGTDIQIGTTTGTKIGTATTQKIGLWNATPIVQPTTAVAAATRVGGGGNTVTDTDTFDGYTIAKLVKALRDMGALA